MTSAHRGTGDLTSLTCGFTSARGDVLTSVTCGLTSARGDVLTSPRGVRAPAVFARDGLALLKLGLRLTLSVASLSPRLAVRFALVASAAATRADDLALDFGARRVVFDLVRSCGRLDDGLGLRMGLLGLEQLRRGALDGRPFERLTSAAARARSLLLLATLATLAGARGDVTLVPLVCGRGDVGRRRGRG